MKAKVALRAGSSRYQNVRQALELLSSDIDLRGKSRIFIKPNMVSTSIQLAATHREALRALLDFLRERYSGRLILGEGTGKPAMEGYRHFGYLELAEKYHVELADLSQEREWLPVQVFDWSFRPITLRYSRLVAESDYRISITPPKTHDAVIVTLSLKNLIMGSLYHELPQGKASYFRNLLRETYNHIPSFFKYSAFLDKLKSRAVNTLSDSDRAKMHQGYAVHHLNLFLLAKAYPVQLSVIDGFQGMQGDGPSAGSPVDWRMAIASQDAVAADCLAAYLMGFRPEDIGYLWYAAQAGLGVGSTSQMEILGETPEKLRKSFQPHPTFKKQLGWRDEQAARLAGI